MDGVVKVLENTELSNAVQVIKSAILQSQQRALVAVNQEQLALYYGIGRFLSENTRNRNWGKGVVDAISERLRKELPGLRGFSAQNLRKMRSFYEEWQMLSGNSLISMSELPIVQFKIDADFPITAFMNIGFTLHSIIINRVKDIEE